MTIGGVICAADRAGSKGTVGTAACQWLVQVDHGSITGLGRLVFMRKILDQVTRRADQKLRPSSRRRPASADFLRAGQRRMPRIARISEALTWMVRSP